MQLFRFQLDHDQQYPVMTSFLCKHLLLILQEIFHHIFFFFFPLLPQRSLSTSQCGEGGTGRGELSLTSYTIGYCSTPSTYRIYIYRSATRMAQHQLLRSCYCCFMAMMGKKVKVETLICFMVIDYDNS